MDLFKDILPSLLQNNNRLLSDENEKEYNPYIVNKALSFHKDCILYANEINKVPDIDKLMQYDYLQKSIRKYKRPFQKWEKLIKSKELSIIKEYYKLSNEKAKELVNIITPSQIKVLEQKLDKGGLKKTK